MARRAQLLDSRVEVQGCLRLVQKNVPLLRLLAYCSAVKDWKWRIAAERDSERPRETSESGQWVGERPLPLLPCCAARISAVIEYSSKFAAFSRTDSVIYYAQNITLYRNR